jgi:hypothetical protein
LPNLQIKYRICNTRFLQQKIRLGFRERQTCIETAHPAEYREASGPYRKQSSLCRIPSPVKGLAA